MSRTYSKITIDVVLLIILTCLFFSYLVDTRLVFARDGYGSDEGPQHEKNNMKFKIVELNKKLALKGPLTISAEEWRILERLSQPKQHTPGRAVNNQIVLPSGKRAQFDMDTPGDKFFMLDNLRKSGTLVGDSLLLFLVKFKSDYSTESVHQALPAGVRSFRRLGKDISLVGIPLELMKNEFEKLPLEWWSPYDSDMKVGDQIHSVSDRKIMLLVHGLDNSQLYSQLSNMPMVSSIDFVSQKMAILSIENSDFSGLLQKSWVQAVFSMPSIGLGAAELGFRPEDSRTLLGATVPTNYDGSSITLGVLDRGVKGQHRALEGRVSGDLEDDIGHGTHVAGVMIASAIDGTSYQGMAPKARILSVDFASMYPPQAFPYFARNSTSIVNNSWNYLDSNDNPVFIYDGNTLVVDDIVDDINSDESQAPLLLIFIAGNNGRDGARSITNPGNGKNVLTVGAVDYTVNGYDGLGRVAYYSSYGPTREGRLKPEVVAPGGTKGLNDMTFLQAENGIVSTNAHGSLNNPELEWPENPNYTRLRGTSMAAPHVTGAAAILVDYWQSKGWQWTADDIKATFVNLSIPIVENSTNPLSGYSSTKTGYGLLNVYSAVNPTPDEISTLLWIHGDLTEGINTQDEWAFTVSTDMAQLAVTLAYTDEAGASLINDLDLELVSPQGNTIAYQLPYQVTEESPIEKIVIENPVSGIWKARVKFADWPNDPIHVSTEEYTILAQGIMNQPVLEIIPPDSVPQVNAGDQFQLTFKVRNNSGYIAAGTSIDIRDSGSVFQFEDYVPRFIGNLKYKNDEKTVRILVQAPGQSGNYNLVVTASCVNKFVDEQSIIVPVIVGESLSDGFQITKISPRWYQPDSLEVFDRCYIDRIDPLTSIPESLENLLWIKTAQNDVRKEILAVNFDINKDCTVFIAHDPRVTTPAWLQNQFEPTGEVLTVTEGNVPLNVWQAAFTAGTVVLGPNGGISNSNQMYLIAIKTGSSIITNRTAKLILPTDIYVAPGDTLNVPVYMLGNDVFNGLQLSIEYDRSSLSFIKALKGGDADNLVLTSINTSPSFSPYYSDVTQNVVFSAQGENLPANIQHEILLLQFLILPSGNAETRLYIDPRETSTYVAANNGQISGSDLEFENSQIFIDKKFFDFQGHIAYDGSQSPIPEIQITLDSQQHSFQTTSDQQGNFLIKEVPKGEYTVGIQSDLPVTNVIDDQDLQLLMRYLGFASSLNSDFVLPLSDVNRDSHIDGVDAVAIMNYLAGRDLSAHAGEWIFSLSSDAINVLKDIYLTLFGGVLGDVKRDWLRNATSSTLAIKSNNKEIKKTQQNVLTSYQGSVQVGTIKVNPYDYAQLPITIKANNYIGLAQLTVQYDSTIIVPANPMFSINDPESILKVSLLNNNLPFNDEGSGIKLKNILVQISSDINKTSLVDSVNLSFNFYGQGGINVSSPVNIDDHVAHSFIVTTDLNLISGEILLIDNGYISVEDVDLPTEFDLVAPSDSSWMTSSLPQFRWTSSSDVTTGLKQYGLVLNDNLNRIVPGNVTTTQPYEPLSNGAYLWYVEASDSTEKIRRSNQVWRFFIDQKAPFSEILYPVHDDSLEVDSLQIKVFAADTLSKPGSGVKWVKVSVDNGQTWHEALQSTFNPDFWTYDWRGITHGRYYLRCKAGDFLENVRESNELKKVTIGDFTRPDPFSLISPISGSWLNTELPLFEWNKAAGADYYNVFINDKLFSTQIPATSSRYQSEHSFADGYYTWFVKAYDAGGNSTTSSQVASLSIDTTPPTSTITYPAAQINVNLWDGFIRGVASDIHDQIQGIGVERVDVSLDSGITWFEATPVEGTFQEWEYHVAGEPQKNLYLMSKAVDSLMNEENPKEFIPITTEILSDGSKIPGDFKILPPFPNPYALSQRSGEGVTIRIQLPKQDEIKIVVYNIRGQEIYREDKQLAPGSHDFRWSCKNNAALPVSAGIYFIHTRTNTRTVLQKIVLFP